jgi:hypothetical protein
MGKKLRFIVGRQVAAVDYWTNQNTVTCSLRGAFSTGGLG